MEQLAVAFEFTHFCAGHISALALSHLFVQVADAERHNMASNCHLSPVSKALTSVSVFALPPQASTSANILHSRYQSFLELPTEWYSWLVIL